MGTTWTFCGSTCPQSRLLVYLDPPFNSSRTYNVLFKYESGEESGGADCRI